MYSFTLTNVHSLYPILPTQPKLVVKCRCNRRLYQEEVYTCLICPSYSCHYCTQIQFVQFQCRSCRKQYQASNKTNRCQFCFSCIQCSNVLTLAKDPQTKHYIFICNFCCWSTKDIKLVQQKMETLFQKLNKYSSTIKDSQLKIYNYAYTFFKQSNLAIQLENQTSKFYGNKKPLKNIIEEDNMTNKQRMEKIQKGFDTIIKKTSLDQPSEEYHVQFKYPQGLPLIAKKIRKCPDCKKPLTAIYRARTDQKAKLTGDPKARHGQQKIQLMHKDIRILLCQYTPLTTNKAKVKLLKDANIDGKQCKKDEVVQVQANKEFQVSIKIQNRMRNTVAEATYIFIVDGPIIKNK